MFQTILTAAQDVLGGLDVLEAIESYELSTDDTAAMLAILEAEGWSAE